MEVIASSVTIFPSASTAALHEAQKRVKANVPNLDWDHRTAEQISPLTFRMQ